MREIDPGRVYLRSPRVEYTLEDIKKMAISLYELGQLHPITVTPQMVVTDGYLRVMGARKLRRGFLTSHRGGIPKWYKKEIRLYTSIHSWVDE